MELSNEFEVQVPIVEAWAVLTDVEGIAPCLPGAQLQEVVTDADGQQEYRGVVKVKVGPITAQYKGAARFTSKDDDTYVAILSASGRDTRGQGNANAIITASLTEAGPTSTHVRVVTDLSLTGKVAQFGRGVLGDVSKKLLDQFVNNLETMVLSARPVSPVVSDAPASVDEQVDEQVEEPASVASVDASATATPVDHDDIDSQSPVEPSVRTIDARPAEAVDLLDAAGSSVVKRALPILGLAFAALIVVRLVRQRRRG